MEERKRRRSKNDKKYLEKLDFLVFFLKRIFENNKPALKMLYNWRSKIVIILFLVYLQIRFYFIFVALSGKRFKIRK